jgi:hypothetical protein
LQDDYEVLRLHMALPEDVRLTGKAMCPDIFVLFTKKGAEAPSHGVS